MKKYITSPDRVITLISVVVVIALFATACAGAAQPVSAAQETTPVMDYEAAYNELLADFDKTVEESKAIEIDYQNQIDELTSELKQEKENAAHAQEERDLAQAERDQALQNMNALREKYSVQYIVVFEMRRKVVFPASEECIRVTIPMTEEEYSRFQETSEVTQVLPCLSIPSDSFNVDWSVIVADTYISTLNIPE